MTYAAHHKDFAPRDTPVPRSAIVAKRTGLIGRLVQAVREWDQRQAGREIGWLVEQSGGRFTDDLERRIERRLSTGNWNARD
jgi:hypothetical protein